MIKVQKRNRENESPKRMEAGKRLVAISIEAKQRKARVRLEKEKSMEGWDINYGYIIGAAVVIVEAGNLYYAYKNKGKK